MSEEDSDCFTLGRTDHGDGPENDLRPGPHTDRFQRLTDDGQVDERVPCRRLLEVHPALVAAGVRRVHLLQRELGVSFGRLVRQPEEGPAAEGLVGPVARPVQLLPSRVHAVDGRVRPRPVPYDEGDAVVFRRRGHVARQSGHAFRHGLHPTEHDCKEKEPEVKSGPLRRTRAGDPSNDGRSLRDRSVNGTGGKDGLRRRVRAS